MMLNSFMLPRPCCCFGSPSCSASSSRITLFSFLRRHTHIEQYHHFCRHRNRHGLKKQSLLSGPIPSILQERLRSEVYVSQASINSEAPGFPGAASDYQFRYRVKEGDTLSSIAAKFRTSVQSIAVSNQITDVNYIPAGKILLVSSAPSYEAQRKDQFPVSQESAKPDKQHSLVIQTEVVPTIISESVITQNAYVKLASVVLVLLAIFHFTRRHGSSTPETVHGRRLEEVQHVDYKPRRRWKGILDEERKLDEVDEVVVQEGQTEVELEEEKLRETYAHLESEYSKFLEDSGLSTSGYWRGGVSPKSQEE